MGNAADWLQFHDDMVYYDGVYYGDWSVFSAETFKQRKENLARLVKFDQPNDYHSKRRGRAGRSIESSNQPSSKEE